MSFAFFLQILRCLGACPPLLPKMGLSMLNTIKPVWAVQYLCQKRAFCDSPFTLMLKKACKICTKNVASSFFSLAVIQEIGGGLRGSHLVEFYSKSIIGCLTGMQNLTSPANAILNFFMYSCIFTMHFFHSHILFNLTALTLLSNITCHFRCFASMHFGTGICGAPLF